jgi:hypothetical protein
MQQKHNSIGILFLQIYNILEDCGKQMLNR